MGGTAGGARAGHERLRRVARLGAALGIAACASASLSEVPTSRLDELRRDGRAFALDDIGPDLSGISYDSERKRFLLVQNRGARLFEYGPDLRTLERVLELRGGPSRDFEAVAWIGPARVALAHELNRVVVVRLPRADDARELSVDPARDDVVELELPRASRRNRGLEALCFDPGGNAGGGTLFALQESSPRRIFRLQRSRPGAELGDPGHTIAIDEPFDAEAAFIGVAEDLSGCAYDARTGRLLVVSERSSLLLDVTLSGEVVRELRLPGVVRGGAAHYEGVAIGPNEALFLVSEPAWFQRASRALILRPLRVR